MTHKTREEERCNLMLRLIVFVVLTSIISGMLIGMALTVHYLK